MKLKKMTEKVKKIFAKPIKFFKGSSSENDVFEKWSEASGKEKIKIIGRFIKQKKSYVIVCVFAVVVIVVSGVVNLKNGVLTKEEEMVNAEEILTESSSSTSISIYSAAAVTPRASAEEKLIFICGLKPSE